MSQIEELRAFVTIVETGSLTQAADRLGIAVSAVSRRLRDLELRLGAALIQRSTRRLYLCLLYTSPSPRDVEESRMPSSA